MKFRRETNFDGKRRILQAAQKLDGRRAAGPIQAVFWLEWESTKFDRWAQLNRLRKKPALYQGTTSVVPQTIKNTPGFSP
jgi:hypothetical protein